MRELSVRLFGPTVKAVCWNIAFCLNAVPTAIYCWEKSCVYGQNTITMYKEDLALNNP